jgi:hypothetical protein
MQASMTGVVIVEKKISQLAAKASEKSIVYVQYCNAKTIGRRIDRFRTVLGTIIPTHCQPLLLQATVPPCIYNAAGPLLCVNTSTRQAVHNGTGHHESHAARQWPLRCCLYPAGPQLMLVRLKPPPPHFHGPLIDYYSSHSEVNCWLPFTLQNLAPHGMLLK